MEKCCESFDKIENELGWYSYDEDNEEETTIYLMPYILSHKDGNKYRVNFCPSCGKDIRNIKIT